MILTDEDLQLPLHELKRKITGAFPDYQWYKYKSHKGEIFVKFKGDYPNVLSDDTHVLIWDWEELLDLPTERFKIWFMSDEEYYNYYWSKHK